MTPTKRRYSLIDRLLTEFDVGLRTLGTGASIAGDPAFGIVTRASPRDDDTAASVGMTAVERRNAAALMRVNHAGEVSAQALYRGQAFTTRDPELRAHLHSAADDERAHLTWCAHRVAELDDRTSLLGPFWYAASFGIGAVAGIAPRRAGLGFVVETERQVERHLDSHLDRLPAGDYRSRAIVSRMRDDEKRHGDEARRSGGSELSKPVRTAMRLMARVMTTVSHRV